MQNRILRLSTRRLAAFAATIATLAGVASSGLMAQPAPEKGRGGIAACRTDLATFCQGIEAGGGKRVQCLQANKDKLSPACASILQERAAKGSPRAVPGATAQAAPPPAGQPPPANAPAPQDQAGSAAAPAPSTQAAPAIVPARPTAGRGANRPMAACRDDMKALCGTVTPGGGAKMRCLAENQAKLSPACATAITAVQDIKQDARLACRNDAQRLCGASKGPERRACLKQNEAQLSPECSAVISKRADAAKAKQQ